MWGGVFGGSYKAIWFRFAFVVFLPGETFALGSTSDGVHLVPERVCSVECVPCRQYSFFQFIGWGGDTQVAECCLESRCKAWGACVGFSSRDGEGRQRVKCVVLCVGRRHWRVVRATWGPTFQPHVLIYIELRVTVRIYILPLNMHGIIYILRERTYWSREVELALCDTCVVLWCLLANVSVSELLIMAC